ncbi:MAG: anaerobic sulfatase maturase [Bacillota bacterium]|nr:anaerobic sulfatase maturase [Bacillota bacterium]
MIPISLLIKPASGLCNLNCEYCFYQDVAANREVGSYGIMEVSVLEAVLRHSLEEADGICAIAWQGGEPTLAGLDFFKKAVDFQRRFNHRNIAVSNSLQTNGYGLGETWASFFFENRFLLGVSLDGLEATHDLFRKNKSGNGSYSSIMKTLDLFRRYRVDYNILTVVNSATARNIKDIYAWYRKQDFRYQQYIACLDQLGQKPGGNKWSLTPEVYGEFLINLFDLWYEDCLRGTAPYIRQFENYIGLLLGILPEACEQRGICSPNLIIEADGSVYPCDFYVTDAYCMGNLAEQPLHEILKSPVIKQFTFRSTILDAQCKHCPYLKLCRGGCYRHRTVDSSGRFLNYFCESYRSFFDHRLDRLKHLAAMIS